MFKNLLIANRGEIACRIIKTAHRLGINTIAVYSDADKHALHVKQADYAYRLGGAPSVESYLNIDKIIAIAKEAKAEAIHPGYGFLSENPDFAKACISNQIQWVGPSPAAMEVMASKQTAKQRLEYSDIPLTPGYHGADQTDDRLKNEAQNLGFPLLIKAANGGGGKGMRIVRNINELNDAILSARRESMKAFGDDTLILERYLEHPRHIEVQILADKHGNVIHLFDRDCSIQRRNQKVIEEAPALHLSETLRQEMREAAINVARAIQYENAGTVEFLVDNHQHFYFIEMNTRLQVEHPVTEMITGLDLVEWQLRIASGESLPSQNQITCTGHAIECRICAEDPYNQFLPSTGTVNVLHVPQAESIRLDTGIVDKNNVSIYYDPMLSKLIGFGPSRAAAAKNLLQGLNDYHLSGIKTNIPLHQAILNHDNFIHDFPNTGFLETAVLSYPKVDPIDALLLCACKSYYALYKSLHDPLFQDTFGFQLYQRSIWVLRFIIENVSYELMISPKRAEHFIARLDDKIYDIEFRLQGTIISVYINQKTQKASVYQNDALFEVYTPIGHITVEQQQNTQTVPPNDLSEAKLTAPMPATIIAILKNKGDTVKKGDKLIILEAMKMEHTLCAPFNGSVESVFYNVGQQVAAGEHLINLIPEAAE